MPDTLAALGPRASAVTTDRLRQATSLLERLVNFDTGTHSLDTLTEASRWLEGNLRELGLNVERHEAAGAGPTLVGRMSGRGRARVLFLAHYDTVFEPGEPQRRPFRSEGGRAYGPGVADMKGGVITLWEALRALRSMGWDDFKTITVVHNADEEVGSPTSRAIIEAEARRADLCLVHEPGRPDGSVVTARKGVARFVLRVRGKAAHAGTHPRDGASAMVALAHKIVAIHGLNDLDRGLTFNSIVTHGGTRSNIIPEQATAEIDMRLPTAALGDEAIARLRAIAGQEHLPGTSAVLEGGVNRPPMESTPGTHSLLAIASQAASTLGLPLKATSTGGGSDGNFVTPLGVPVLDGLGAVGGAYHSSDEWLDLSSIPQRAALTALLVWEACRRGEFVR